MFDNVSDIGSFAGAVLEEVETEDKRSTRCALSGKGKDASSRALEDTDAAFFCKDGVPRRLGIMGGTFDPIHLGHLNCAERAMEALGLDGVLFIPAGDPVFKQDRDIASTEARLAMCELAVADNPSFCVSDIEIRRHGITYTGDTLEHLRAAYGADVEFVFIIGADSLLTLSDWKDASRLASLANFACVSRPGYEVDPEIVNGLCEAGFHIEFVKAPMFDISSSEVRALCKAGSSIRYLVPYAIRAFITQYGLYGDERGEGRPKIDFEGSDTEWMY